MDPYHPQQQQQHQEEVTGEVGWIVVEPSQDAGTVEGWSEDAGSPPSEPRAVDSMAAAVEHRPAPVFTQITSDELQPCPANYIVTPSTYLPASGRLID